MKSEGQSYYHRRAATEAELAQRATAAAAREAHRAMADAYLKRADEAPLPSSGVAT